MKIISRFDGCVLKEVPGDTLRCADLQGADLRWADLQGADLQGADLRWADLRWAVLQGADLTRANLRGADLEGADLRDADLEGEKLTLAPMQLIGLRWPVLITGQYLRIGCQRHPHETWAAFSDAEIDVMETGALEWWAEHKAFILGDCEFHRAAVERASAEKETTS